MREKCGMVQGSEEVQTQKSLEADDRQDYCGQYAYWQEGRYCLLAYLTTVVTRYVYGSVIHSPSESGQETVPDYGNIYFLFQF